MELSRPEPELLKHLVVELGAHGRRAVEFLNTAQGLLTVGPNEAPRLAEAIAYCLREAMKAIPASRDAGDGGLWKQVSREVVDAATRYKRRKDKPGEDEQGALNDLFTRVEDLQRFHDQEGVHEQRLIAVIVNRTGALPVAAGTAPIKTYQNLLGQLDKAVHGDVSFAEAQVLWEECLGILRRLFLPPEIRHAELDVLAGIESPGSEDVTRLLQLVAGPNHLQHFLGRVANPKWLELLTKTGVLKPPNENGPWPAFAAVDHLAGEHAGALAAWLTRMYELYGVDPVRGWFVARAAVDVGDEALDLVVRALKDHPTSSAIVDLGIWAVEKVDPADELTARLADVLFNEASWRSAGFVDPVVERFVNGVEADNAKDRLRLLCFKLCAIDDSDRSMRRFAYERAGSIADRTGQDRDDRFTVLLAALVDAMERAQQWLPWDEMLAIVVELPPPIASRVRAWLLGTNPDVDTVRLIDELTRAIGERSPTGDDLGLIDKVVELCDPSQYAEVWREALGPVPTIADVGRGLATGELAKEWVRAHQWLALLPGVAGAWAGPASVIAAAYGQPTRDTLERRRRAEFSFGRSPIAVQQLQELTTVEAAQAIASWRPDPSEWLLSARELARTIETVVKSAPASWLAEPLRVATELRQPTYIHHYLSAVAEICKVTPVPVDELLDVIALVRAHPWVPISLGRDDFEFDRDWRGAERAAVEVIKALADADVGFNDRSDEVWLILQSEVLNRGEPSGIVGGTRDPLDDAINRPCTSALDAVLSFMAHEFRTADRVRPEILELLTDSLRLDGLDGAEHRAILATRIGFLRHVAPDWMDDVAALFFGPEAPDDLGQLAVDQALKWSSTNTWLLENFRSLVRNAVTSGVEHALDHALIAMLRESPGYGVQDNIKFLRTSAPLLSQAGQALGHLLRHDQASEHHLQIAMRFWHAAIATKVRDGLAGFGWFAEIAHMDSTDWASTTLETLRTSGGRIDRSHKVAERAVALSPSETTLAIMNELVRGTVDEWDQRGNIERAVTLIGAADGLETTDEYIRLQTTLRERGAL